MRETEERRRLVQQHMVNLKRQRALEAERGRMAREETLTLLLMQEEERCAGLRVGGGGLTRFLSSRLRGVPSQQLSET